MTFAFDWAIFWSVLAALGVWFVVYTVFLKARIILFNEKVDGAERSLWSALSRIAQELKELRGDVQLATQAVEELNPKTQAVIDRMRNTLYEAQQSK